MTKRKLYLSISISLVIISILGFIFTTENKSSLIIFEKSGSAESFEFDINLTTNTDYVFAFWVIDEEGGFQWASVSAYSEIEINDSIVYAKSIEFSESDETAGLKRAQNGFNFNYHSESRGIAKFRGTMHEGDQWQIEVYEDLSEVENMKPGLFIILLIVALFLFMKVRRIEKQD